MIWYILGAISVVLLVVYWARKNAVWGGFTGGLFIGLTLALVFYFRGDIRGTEYVLTKEHIFHWQLIVRWAIAGTIFGFAPELLAMVSKKLFKK